MLSEIIDAEETLARVACGSSKFIKNKSFFYKDKETGVVRANVALFIDNRNPAELSINRISTLKKSATHELGLIHKNEYQPMTTYWGYAKIKAEICYSKNCRVVKDDIGGTKPFHANIIFPKNSEFIEIQEIAVYFALKSTFKIFETD